MHHSGSLTSSRRKRFAYMERLKREAGNETSKEEESDGHSETEVEAAAAEAKSSEEQEQFACIKAMAAGMIFRSCVPKVSSMNLNCTSVLGQNVLCYCHTDACNKSSHLNASIWALIISMLIAYACPSKQ